VFKLTGASSVRADARVGAAFQLTFDGRGTVSGRFLDLSTNERLRLAWNVSGFGRLDERTIVEVWLASSGTGCAIEVQHLDVGSPESAEAKARAWESILSDLDALLTTAGLGARARPATISDAHRIADIYNQGIEERIATFETKLRTTDDVRAWFDDVHPIVVVEKAGSVIAFASTSSYRQRACYARIAEFAVYVAREARRTGVGRLALEDLCRAAAAAGFWKLVSRVFVENAASRRLLATAGFREVGIYERHAELDGNWRDVVIVEKLLR
jgi:phosphinothricin acetyltransferase